MATPIIGGQWVKAESGDFPLDFVVCENANDPNDPNVPIAAELQPIGG